MSEIRKMKEKLTENEEKTNQKMVLFESKHGELESPLKVFTRESKRGVFYSKNL